MRFLLARDNDLLSQVLTIFLRKVFAWQRRRARALGIDDPQATVPKITVITRKAYGGAYDVMASKHIRADVNLAFPAAEIAVMGPDGAVNIIYRGQLDKIRDDAERAAARARFVDEYRTNFANPYKAASLGYIDEIIRPRETRGALIRSLRLLANKRQTNPPRKHGNIPL